MITVTWEMFRHDGTGVVIGQEVYKQPNKYARCFTLRREKITVIGCTDDLSISTGEARNFARALMSGQLISKKVEGIKGEDSRNEHRLCAASDKQSDSKKRRGVRRKKGDNWR